MTYLRNIAANAPLLEVFARYRATAEPLIDYHEALMRGPSPLSPGERELIATYVSALNACAYCHGVHAATAREFGVDAEVLDAMLSNIESAPVEERLRPILRYVKQLTEAPTRMTQAHADAVFAAGWDDQALHDAASVCALFNLMNRLVEGLGIRADEQYHHLAGRRLHSAGYAGLKSLIRSTADDGAR